MLYKTDWRIEDEQPKPTLEVIPTTTQEEDSFTLKLRTNLNNLRIKLDTNEKLLLESIKQEQMQLQQKKINLQAKKHLFSTIQQTFMTDTANWESMAKLDAVRLNIGGTPFTVSRAILLRIPYFESMLNGSWSESKLNRDEEIIVGHSAYYFKYLIQYLVEGEWDAELLEYPNRSFSIPDVVAYATLFGLEDHLNEWVTLPEISIPKLKFHQYPMLTLRIFGFVHEFLTKLNHYEKSDKLLTVYVPTNQFTYFVSRDLYSHSNSLSDWYYNHATNATERIQGSQSGYSNKSLANLLQSGGLFSVDEPYLFTVYT